MTFGILKNKINILLVTFLLCFSWPSNSQYTYEHISNKGIYDFLDEMANSGFIALNTTAKPFTRALIHQKLTEIQDQQQLLNKRQKKELKFYARDFALMDSTGKNPIKGNPKGDIFGKNTEFATDVNPFGVFYKDKDFKLGFRPIWGIEHLSNERDDFTRTWGGARIYGNIGKHFGFYASLRENHMDKVLSRPGYITRDEAGVYKSNNIGGGDYSEMRGGLVYGWKWGEAAIMKDHLEWGDNYHGSIINSGNYPSFGMIKLHLNPAKWIDFNYFHGWLVSEVIDSTRSYLTPQGANRKIFRPKYMAANIFTFIPFKGVDVSIGNSIVYGDIPIQAAYLVPFMFYKSIDHTINANIENQNSQMFANLSLRIINNLHLYGNVFIDEFSKERVGDPNRHNFHSWKTGAKLSNWPVRNISLTYEFTKSNPITYKHRVPVLTYATNQYTLGSYLKDNAKEQFFEFVLKPYALLRLKANYTYAIHGNEYEYLITKPFMADKHGFIEDKVWDNESISFHVDFEFSSNSYIFLGYIIQDINGYDADKLTGEDYLEMYTPSMFHGNTSTIQAGINWGF
jgi:hypothetical protein